jgi:steroid delta-isomerase-like uncharacterized protein
MPSNSDIVRRWWEEVWNGRQYDVADELLAPDFVVHVRWSNPAFGGPTDVPGVQPSKDVVKRWATSFPDFHVSIEELLEGADAVTCVHMFTGTDSGNLEGRPGPSTGKAFSMPGITAMRVRDGKIQEAWTCWDIVSLMEEINAMPRLGSGPLGALSFIGSNVKRLTFGRLSRSKTPATTSSPGA